MSEQNGDTGSKDRATVSLVNAKIDTVLEKIEGNARLTAANFENLQNQIAAVAQLPSQVAAQHEMITLAQARISITEADIAALKRAREHDADDAKAFRRIHLPSLLIAGLALAVAAAALFIH